MSEYERERADWGQDKRYFEETVKSLKTAQEKHSETLTEIKTTIIQAKAAVVTAATGISIIISLIQWVVGVIVK